MWKRGLWLLCAAFLVSGCSSGQNGNQTATPAPASLHNPLNFALYPGALIMSVHDFTQKVDVSNGRGSGTVFDSGNGTYAGHEVLATSGASFTDLSSWVTRLASSPPPGYAEAENGGNPNTRSQAQRYGVDYVAFTKKENGRNHGVLVVVMDPERVNQRFGRLLGMVAKYRMLPQAMRAPIDNEAKARFGMTITDATQPESPIGATLAALDQFQNKNARGIVVLDAVKQ